MEIFLETFRRLDMAVVWKWDGEVDNLPSNVFVTHGGLGSLTEAIYHKAVIVGIPFSNNQKPNLLRAARHGYARSLDWESSTTEDLTNGINDAINDEGMKAAMERIHTLYVDRE